MGGVLIRFWTPTTPGFRGDRFPNLGLEYLRALKETDLRVRAISTTGGHIDAKTPWGEVESLFTTPHGVPEDTDFINVVCTDQAADLAKLWTRSFRNIALTGFPKNKIGVHFFAAVGRYEAICSVSQEDLAAFAPMFHNHPVWPFPVVPPELVVSYLTGYVKGASA